MRWSSSGARGRFDTVEPPGQQFSGWAAIDVVFGNVDEILLAESPLGFGAGGQWLGHERRRASLLAGEDLFALEVATVGNDRQRLLATGVASLLRHFRELGAVHFRHWLPHAR